jgi:hypothetical protein
MTLEQIRAVQALSSMQAVKVTDETLVRHDQIGVFVGADHDEPGHVLVRFESASGDPAAPQELDSMPVESVQGLN